MTGCPSCLGTRRITFAGAVLNCQACPVACPEWLRRDGADVLREVAVPVRVPPDRARRHIRDDRQCDRKWMSK